MVIVQKPSSASGNTNCLDQASIDGIMANQTLENNMVQMVRSICFPSSAILLGTGSINIIGDEYMYTSVTWRFLELLL